MWGYHVPYLFGDAKNVSGCVNGIKGDITEFKGCCSGISGQLDLVSYITRNLDDLQIIKKKYGFMNIRFHQSFYSVSENPVLFKSYSDVPYDGDYSYLSVFISLFKNKNISSDYPIVSVPDITEFTLSDLNNLLEEAITC